MFSVLSLSLPALCGFLLLGLNGCDISSGDDVVRNVGGTSISGLYTNGGGRLVSPTNSGNALTSLNVIQTGDRLEAVGNDGQIYRGTIGNIIDNLASFTLSGTTSAGIAATLSGTIRIDGTTGVMTGTWIEPGLFGTVSASAAIAGQSGDGDNGNGNGDLSISGPTTLSVGNSGTYTATGGSGSINWSIGNSSIGSPSNGTSSSFTYTASATGTQTITLTRGVETTSISVTQN